MFPDFRNFDRKGNHGLSLETKSDDDMKWIYPLRGMNTNGKQIGVSLFSEEDTAYVYNAQLATTHVDFLQLI